jgi:hypothetical protein
MNLGSTICIFIGDEPALLYDCLFKNGSCGPQIFNKALLGWECRPLHSVSSSVSRNNAQLVQIRGTQIFCRLLLPVCRAGTGVEELWYESPEFRSEIYTEESAKGLLSKCKGNFSGDFGILLMFLRNSQ